MRNSIFCAMLTACALGGVFGGEGRPVRYGCAYYPEAWPKETWARDLRDMKEMGLSIIRVGEFNWSGFEPEEGRFDFADYTYLLTLCEEIGIDVMMCTPTATVPPWMHRKYPECEKSRRDGWRPGLGDRQTRCPSSEKFRFFSKRIAEKMAEAFKDFSCIKWWQIDNELHIVAGSGLCECPSCVKGFRAWMKARYGTLDELNRAWNHAFWSSKFSDWEEIDYPIQRGREPWMTEYVRFQSDNFLGFAREQREAIRKFVPNAVTTSNGSEMSGWLRLDTLYRDCGYVATDTYVKDAYQPRAKWMWGLSRGLTGRQRPFMVAEMGPFTWDADKTNGDDDLYAWVDDTVRHGAEAVIFFRWRQSVNGEQYHPAILPWSGRKGDAYARVKKIASTPRTVTLPKTDVAVLHSNESDQDTLVRGNHIQFGQYEDASILLNLCLEKRGILPDYLMSSPDVDFAGYRTVFVPLNTIMSAAVAEKLKAFVRAGGRVVALTRLNVLDPKGGSYYTEPYPVGLTDLFGLEVNEQRARGDWKHVYDRVEPKGCEVLAPLTEGVFAGSPGLTRMKSGAGEAYYVASLPTTEAAMTKVLDAVMTK